MSKRRKFVLSTLVALLAFAMRMEAGTVLPLRDGWRIESGCKARIDGENASMPGFDVQGWLRTSVPSTVLAAQVAAGVFPDPYFGANLRSIPGTSYPIGKIFSKIPMAEDSPYRCGWWYRTEFTAPAAKNRDDRFWLHFDGINYRANVWLNGHKIADTASVAGAYRNYDFDATELLLPGKANVLAVETFAPTEKDLGINWVDWNPSPPDKDMGLWGAVDVERTGAVTLHSPLAVTHFSDDTLGVAELTVYVELHNGSDRTVKGILAGTAAGARFEEPIELAAHEEKTVAITAERFPALKIHHPQPWWPRQMGQPHLEQLALRFTMQGSISDEKSTAFGLREITSELTANGSRLFRINGKPLLIRGGGWSQDMLLRTDEKRLRDQLRMVRDLNLNTIRQEGKLETDEFYRLADEQGILIMAGWCCCDHWEDWKNWSAEDQLIASASLRAQMLRLRSHASMLVWLNGSDNPPPADVERAYLEVERETHWPNPVLSSASSAATSVSGASGVKMTGPYDYVAPSYWYVDQSHGGGFGFNTETGPGVAIPSRASRARFLPDPDAWPPTANWNLHNGGGRFSTRDVFDAAMEAVYAKPQSAAEYERLAQTMAYDSERAMFEAYSRNKYTATGVIQWMLNNAWPSMIWHLWDNSLDAGGGYFAVKKACEPLHIQYSYDDRSVVVVNSTYERALGLRAEVHVRTLDWKEVYTSQAEIDAAPDSAQRVFMVPDGLFSSADKVLFIDLQLRDALGHDLSENFYWVPMTLTAFDWAKGDYTHTPAARHEDLTALANLPQAKIEADAELVDTKGGKEIRVHIANPSTVLAFQLRAAIRTATGGLIAPVLWSDNWIEVTPGASRLLTALLPEGTEKPVVTLEGWNVTPLTLSVHAEKTVDSALR